MPGYLAAAATGVSRFRSVVRGVLAEDDGRARRARARRPAAGRRPPAARRGCRRTGRPRDRCARPCRPPPIGGPIAAAPRHQIPRLRRPALVGPPPPSSSRRRPPRPRPGPAPRRRAAWSASSSAWVPSATILLPSSSTTRSAKRDGRQAVGDDQRGAALHQDPQAGVDRLLDLDVDGAGGVVEDQDRAG